jgi:two-component system, OmpR family, KDP operon response regulator KdpE
MLSAPIKVLVVDDEALLRKSLRKSLTASGFFVEEAASGEQALEIVRQHAFDMVLLDINMPGMGGLDACCRIRGLSPQIGIIMVTVNDLEEDKVCALDSGADDYITKPFRLRELVARLGSVLRRLQPQDQTGMLKAGSLELDLQRRRVWKNGEDVHLSPTEFELLVFFMKNAGAPLTHAKLLHAIWGPEYGNELDYLRSYIRMLRKKIESDPANPQYLVTEPWVGYRFRDPANPESHPATLEDGE